MPYVMVASPREILGVGKAAKCDPKRFASVLHVRQPAPIPNIDDPRIDGRILLANARGFVGRLVVNDDNADVRVILEKKRLERFGELRCVVEYWYAHRNQRARMSPTQGFMRLQPIKWRYSDSVVFGRFMLK